MQYLSLLYLVFVALTVEIRYAIQDIIIHPLHSFVEGIMLDGVVNNPIFRAVAGTVNAGHTPCTPALVHHHAMYSNFCMVPSFTWV
jgi:hypothetical protein